MGCYFSKEISDLILMYSEYKYLLVAPRGKLRLLRRYADDGIMILSGGVLETLEWRLET